MSSPKESAYRKLTLFAIAIAAVIAVDATERANLWPNDNQVHVDGGWVAGTPGVTQDVRVFKGIPYAAPPTGDLRWRPPQPVIPWEGVRKANIFAASCAQAELKPTNIFYEELNSMSEDCLYLNVWTSARTPDERRPVLLWIHDGGLFWSGASRPAYDGSVLSQKGLVVVNFNYRLGVFGMLAHPELSRESRMGVSGNYALLDMVAAIKWTRRNIASFGGDPNRITLYGESVGARAASALSIAPLVKGDLHGVIAGDTVFGFSVATANLAAAESTGVKFLKVAGAASIRDLRSMPADDLIAASSKFMEHGVWIEFIVDDWALTGNINAAEKSGAAPDIPILTGSTADFATVLIDPVPAKEFVAASRKTYGQLADRFLALYPARTDVEATASQWAAVNDFIAWEHGYWATLHTKAGHRAYVYFFTHAVPPPNGRTTFKGGRLPERLGAYHTGEIPYPFDSLARVDRAWTSADQRLADIMSSYWVNFAANGNPNGPGLPIWPAYGKTEGPAMELGDAVRTLPRVLDKTKTQFWTDYIATKAAN